MTDIPEFVVRLAYTHEEASNLLTAVQTTNRMGFPEVINDTLDFVVTKLQMEMAKYRPLQAEDRVYYSNDKKRLGTVLAIQRHGEDLYAMVAWDEAGRSPVTTVPAKNLRRA